MVTEVNMCGPLIFFIEIVKIENCNADVTRESSEQKNPAKHYLT